MLAMRTRPPHALLAAVLLLGVLVAAGLSLAVGSRDIGVTHVWLALTGQVQGPDATVITTQRLPRTILGVVVGAALGMAGALMQGHTRNPLADPGLFGVNAGASFAVAVVTFVFPVSNPALQVAAAMTGAGAVSLLIFVIARSGRRGGDMVLVAVIGTTVSALLSALTVTLILSDRRTLEVLRAWEVGAIDNRNLDLGWYAWGCVAVGMLLALVNAHGIDALALGEDVAMTHGIRSGRIRTSGIAAITLLAGPATALCGPIALLGLVAPHVVRPVCGHVYRWIVPLSAFTGIALVLVADVIGRVIAPPGELQVSLVMSVVGGPLLLAVARRRRMVAL